jgi:hypothetical protein
LRVQCGIQRLAGMMERRSKRIAHQLKDISLIRLNGLIENLMMPRKQSRHFIRMLLCEFGAAFDIRE